MGLGESPTDIISENHFEQISSQIWLLKTVTETFFRDINIFCRSLMFLSFCIYMHCSFHKHTTDFL